MDHAACLPHDNRGAITEGTVARQTNRGTDNDEGDEDDQDRTSDDDDDENGDHDDDKGNRNTPMKEPVCN